MADSNFYKKNGNFRLSYLASISECELQDPKHAELVIEDVAPLDTAGAGHITFLQNPKYLNQFKTTKASACVVDKKNAAAAPEGIALLISADPYYSYAKIVEKFYHKDSLFFSVSESAYVDPTASIGDLTVVMPGAYIGPGCKIGRNCVIHPNTTIVNSIVGNDVIIHSGTRIGQDGFGYAFHNGRYQKIMQLGRVIIGNDVEIGANCAIDRGAGPDTVIGEGTKIDNLVQIGHNVKIGKHCVIVAQTGISGSTELGDYVVIGAQAGIVGHIKVGSRVQAAARAGITKDIPDGSVVGGFPAVPIQDFRRQAVALKKLAAKKGSDNE